MKKKIKKVHGVKKSALVKSLSELMKDEDGFVSKETILKVGLSTIAALGMTSALTDTSTGQTHTNSVTPGPGGCATHTNITTHSSY